MFGKEKQPQYYPPQPPAPIHGHGYHGGPHPPQPQYAPQYGQAPMMHNGPPPNIVVGQQPRQKDDSGPGCCGICCGTYWGMIAACFCCPCLVC